MLPITQTGHLPIVRGIISLIKRYGIFTKEVPSNCDKYHLCSEWITIRSSHVPLQVKKNSLE